MNNLGIRKETKSLMVSYIPSLNFLTASATIWEIEG